jgi:hypothetical protein
MDVTPETNGLRLLSISTLLLPRRAAARLGTVLAPAAEVLILRAVAPPARLCEATVSRLKENPSSLTPLLTPLSLSHLLGGTHPQNAKP